MHKNIFSLFSKENALERLGENEKKKAVWAKIPWYVFGEMKAKSVRKIVWPGL